MGQGIFNFPKELWTPRRLSWSPPYSSLVPSLVPFLLWRGDLGLEWPQGRAWAVAEQ